MDKGGEIRVNRAPVLTLWAAIVAERLGHGADAAITLGRAVAGSSARLKARAIGVEEKHEGGDLRDAAKHATRPTPQQTVHLLGRDVSVVEQKGSQYALDGDKPASPRPPYAYVERAFGEHLPAVRRAMEGLADSLSPEELNRTGFRLYEQFRPEVPAGANGCWGAKGVLTSSESRTPATDRYAAATSGAASSFAAMRSLAARSASKASSSARFASNSSCRSNASPSRRS